MEIRYDPKAKTCRKKGYLCVTSLHDQSEALVLSTENNADPTYPNGNLYVKNGVPAWAGGPGSRNKQLNTKIPEKIIEEIEKAVKNGCKPWAPAHADKSFVCQNVAYIPTVSSLCLDTEDPTWTIKKTEEEILEKSPFDKIFFSEDDKNNSHCHMTDDRARQIGDEIKNCF